MQQALKALARGWALTPLRGKVPIIIGWQRARFPTEAQVTAWAKAGNVGLRTGAVSGIVVVDVDAGGDVTPLHLPPTVTAITGSDNLHLYFSHAGGTVPNSVGKLVPHVDVRGDGGQVVYVGSIHPETGKMYRWAEGQSPDDISLAVLPSWVLSKLRSYRFADSAYCARPLPRPQRGQYGRSRYGQVALNREVQALQAAPGGIRNTTLNKAAFNLGRLVAAGHLSQQEVWLRLEWTASLAGLSPRETAGTIRSGLAAGIRRS
ncbi:MAG: bifunctional DNA primase/polymerase [Candidatus Polarisedimenticolia bacterium]